MFIITGRAFASIARFPQTLFQWCVCANMAHLAHWRKLCDVEGGAADASQATGVTPRGVYRTGLRGGGAGPKVANVK